MPKEERGIFYLSESRYLIIMDTIAFEYDREENTYSMMPPKYAVYYVMTRNM